jgi:hypothetical protein
MSPQGCIVTPSPCHAPAWQGRFSAHRCEHHKGGLFFLSAAQRSLVNFTRSIFGHSYLAARRRLLRRWRAVFHSSRSTTKASSATPSQAAVASITLYRRICRRLQFPPSLLGGWPILRAAGRCRIGANAVRALD